MGSTEMLRDCSKFVRTVYVTLIIRLMMVWHLANQLGPY